MADKRCPVIIDGVECGLPIEEYAAEVDLFLQIFRCALGHRSYAALSEVNLNLNPISFGVVEFRRKPTAETWHFWPTCSQWPTDDFISSKDPSGAYEVCNECIVKSQSER